MRRALSCLAYTSAFALLPGLCGCMSAVKHAYYEMRGAQAELVFNDNSGDTALAKYPGLRFTPVTTTLGSKICPVDLAHLYDGYAADLLDDLAPLYPGGSPTATIDSDVLFFQKKGLLSEAELLMRIRIRAEDKLIVDAILKTESKAYRAGDEGALAKVAVKRLGTYLKKQKGIAEDEGKDKDRDKERDKSRRGKSKKDQPPEE